MISKRDKVSQAEDIKVLQAILYSKESEEHLIPEPVKQLYEGNMSIITPQIIPFLSNLLKKINMHINEKNIKNLVTRWLKQLSHIFCLMMWSWTACLHLV
jgi:hypothetical protein